MVNLYMSQEPLDVERYTVIGNTLTQGTTVSEREGKRFRRKGKTNTKQEKRYDHLLFKRIGRRMLVRVSLVTFGHVLKIREEIMSYCCSGSSSNLDAFLRGIVFSSLWMKSIAVEESYSYDDRELNMSTDEGIAFEEKLTRKRKVSFFFWCVYVWEIFGFLWVFEKFLWIKGYKDDKRTLLFLMSYSHRIWQLTSIYIFLICCILTASPLFAFYSLSGKCPSVSLSIFTCLILKHLLSLFVGAKSIRLHIFFHLLISNYDFSCCRHNDVISSYLSMYDIFFLRPITTFLLSIHSWFSRRCDNVPPYSFLYTFACQSMIF